MVCIQQSTLNEYLDIVKPSMPQALIGNDGWANIESVCQLLPNQITSFFGFECRLTETANQADFLLCIGDKEIGRDILAGNHSRFSLPQELSDHPVWQHIQQFTTQWLEPDSPLNQHVSNIWLEFDVDGPAETPPVPSCFFGSESIYTDTDIDIDTPNSDHTWVTQTAMQQLQGHRVDAQVEQQLFRCLEALPSGTHVFQVGLMLARCSEQVRICLRGISTTQTLEYLQRIGWPGSLQALKSLLLEVVEQVDRIDVDLDVGCQGVSAKLGLECYINRQPQLEPKWISFLDYLVNKGWCLGEKRQALLDYPGYTRQRDYSGRWPVHFVKLSQWVGDGSETVFFRGLHHIKLVVVSDHVQDVKAYCWVKPHLLSQSVLQREVSVQFPEFLEPSINQNILEFAVAHEADFLSSMIEGEESKHSVRTHIRNSKIYAPSLTTLKEPLIHQIYKALPVVLNSLGIEPFPIAHIEVQLTAHNDGHYYKPHSDHIVDSTAVRFLTFVYYFHRTPCPFWGGELRLFHTTMDKLVSSAQVAGLIKPTNNSIVFFPSQNIHEVLPINCPSKAFEDSRFTLNGWIWRSLSAQTANNHAH